MIQKTALICILLLSSWARGQKPQAACDHTQWILSVLQAADTIKPGMTRKQLLRIFTEEGGLSTRMERTYVYKDCPYIKVNVEFQPVDVLKHAYDEGPNDKIVKISQPFIESSVSD